MDLELTAKVVLITGVSRGIGRAAPNDFRIEDARRRRGE
jgi:NAD(P)-dependent dehydrogenase (short-subunit alcohol dehydrogenase family)